MDMVDKVARSEATVLILGETGTGKELVARAIHGRSPRANGPFIPINCASLSESLLESELFGHEKGAFTGAHRAKPGRFELADGGTLFLDEIGEIPLGIQAKLLRALQDSIIYRVGGINPIKVDIRLLAATNRDLQRAMDDGDFRKDLFYRIAVFPIEIPPLSERREDVPALARYFLRKAGYSAGISKKAIDVLSVARWRGNIRELFNVLERATILAAGKIIEPKHFPPLEDISRGTVDRPETLEDMERAALIDAIRKCGGNKTKAAKKLGITRRMVYSRMKKLDISEDDMDL
jgi:transcriptional regulator with GAF, ATPase, and Fis domain